MSLAHAETERLRFAYRTHGDPESGLPMLLVHGSHASSRWWFPLLALLPDEIYAVAPDLRGCGASDKPATGYEIESQAEDLLAFVDAMGWRDFDLVAHSSGTAIATEFTLRHPERVTTLILISAVPVEGVHTPPDAMMVLEQMREDRDLLARAIAATMPSFDHQERPDNRENAHFFARLVDDAAGMAPAAFTDVAFALNRWNRFAEAQSLTLPTLLVRGDLDTIINKDAATRNLIAIPGANNLEVLRGVGHSPMIEAPLNLAERLLEFITEDFDDFDRIRDMAEE